jgi:hypothetical protein
MGLLRSLFWLALFLVSTFSFTVIFEHGFSDFAGNSEKEWGTLVKYYHEVTGGKPKTTNPAL